MGLDVTGLGAVANAAGKLLEILGAPFEGWQERKTIKVQSKLRIAELNAESKVKLAEANIERAKRGVSVVVDWDTIAQKGMGESIKDELIAFIWFYPVAALFFSAFYVDPAFQNRVILAVQALNQFPLWYKIMLWGIIAAVFGLRWLVQPMIHRKLIKENAIDPGIDQADEKLKALQVEIEKVKEVKVEIEKLKKAQAEIKEYAGKLDI